MKCWQARLDMWATTTAELISVAGMSCQGSLPFVTHLPILQLFILPVSPSSTTFLEPGMGGIDQPFGDEQSIHQPLFRLFSQLGISMLSAVYCNRAFLMKTKSNTNSVQTQVFRKWFNHVLLARIYLPPALDQGYSPNPGAGLDCN